MQQILFHLPFINLPVPAFGATLFLTFIACMAFCKMRAARQGIPRERMESLAIVLLLSGLFGARLFFVIQYRLPWVDFFKIWEGGIVFYGSVMGGALGYIVYYWTVLRKEGVSTWTLADIVAPTLALGLVMGRIGCLLNGCCYGQVACDDCPALHFPLLTGPPRDMVVRQFGYQSSLGFAARGKLDDPRSVVTSVEPDSQALEAGLKAGDIIVGVNGRPNAMVMTVAGEADARTALAAKLEQFEAVILPVESMPKWDRIRVERPIFFLPARDVAEAVPGVTLQQVEDFLSNQVRNWPKGGATIQLDVERDGRKIALPGYLPRSLGLQPTQIYESISMALLLALLLAYFPFRRHDGQVFVMWMLGYAVHRFLNEMLRNDTEPVIGKLTASMAVSLLVFAGALILEAYLRATQARRQPVGPS